MPRQSLEHLSVSDLERILARRKKALSRLLRTRDRLARQLARVDRDIRAAQGDSTNVPAVSPVKRVRPKNEKSLADTLEIILRKAGKPMKVGDLASEALKSGYKSHSPDFRSLVNQMLIKDKRFAKAERGLYQMKK